MRPATRKVMNPLMVVMSFSEKFMARDCLAFWLAMKMKNETNTRLVSHYNESLPDQENVDFLKKHFLILYGQKTPKKHWCTAFGRIWRTFRARVGGKLHIAS